MVKPVEGSESLLATAKTSATPRVTGVSHDSGGERYPLVADGWQDFTGLRGVFKATDNWSFQVEIDEASLARAGLPVHLRNAFVHGASEQHVRTNRETFPDGQPVTLNIRVDARNIHAFANTIRPVPGEGPAPEDPS